eukprot:gene10109-biopygen2560
MVTAALGQAGRCGAVWRCAPCAGRRVRRRVTPCGAVWHHLCRVKRRAAP